MSEYRSGLVSDMGTMLSSPDVLMPLPQLVPLLQWSVVMSEFLSRQYLATAIREERALSGLYLEALYCLCRFYVSLHTFRGEGIDGYQLTQQLSSKCGWGCSEAAGLIHGCSQLQGTLLKFRHQPSILSHSSGLLCKYTFLKTHYIPRNCRWERRWGHRNQHWHAQWQIPLVNDMWFVSQGAPQ